MEPDLSFYSTAAQIIPVLFLTFLIEGFVVAEKGLKPLAQATSIVQYLGLIFVFVYGEVISLGVLADGKVGDGDQSAVTASLAIGTGLITLPILLRYARSMSEKAGEAVGVVAALALVVAVVWLIH